MSLILPTMKLVMEPLLLVSNGPMVLLPASAEVVALLLDVAITEPITTNNVMMVLPMAPTVDAHPPVL